MNVGPRCGENPQYRARAFVSNGSPCLNPANRSINRNAAAAPTRVVRVRSRTLLDPVQRSPRGPPKVNMAEAGAAIRDGAHLLFESRRQVGAHRREGPGLFHQPISIFRAGIEARYVKRRWYREASGPTHVRPIVPVGAPGIASRRERVVHGVALTRRHFSPDIKVGPPRDLDYGRGAVWVMDDGARRLNHRAARGAQHRLLLFCYRDCWTGKG